MQRIRPSRASRLWSFSAMACRTGTSPARARRVRPQATTTPAPAQQPTLSSVTSNPSPSPLPLPAAGLRRYTRRLPLVNSRHTTRPSPPVGTLWSGALGWLKKAPTRAAAAAADTARSLCAGSACGWVRRQRRCGCGAAGRAAGNCTGRQQLAPPAVLRKEPQPLHSCTAHLDAAGDAGQRPQRVFQLVVQALAVALQVSQRLLYCLLDCRRRVGRAECRSV